MKISLIGMSGSGKSYWSKKLEEKGFKRICCDDLIEKRLDSELKKLGYSGISDVSKWMGQPYDKRYKKNSQKYLRFEIEVMEEICNYLKRADNNENIVVDTTGSVIYIDNNILNSLKQYSKIVNLHTPSLIQKKMYEEYMKNPKPVIWADAFSKMKKESNIKALMRCYPNLLNLRIKKYKDIAEIIFDYYILRDNIFDESKFIEIIKKYD